MISSYEELLKKIEELDYGPTTFTIKIENDRLLDLVPEPAPYKHRKDDVDWLDYMINRVSRVIDPQTGKWKASSRSINDIHSRITDNLKIVITHCVDAKVPARTSLYKDYVKICAEHGSDPQFLTDIIQVINYYKASTTDSTCKSNVVSLLKLVKKKYDKKMQHM